MPPKQPRLTAAEIALVRRWIDAGAIGPTEETITASKGPDRSHWSFRPVVRPPLPKVHNPGWCRNGIDYFILQQLEAQGISPSPEADRVTLIRRLSLDLLGLPPTPEEVDAFVHDTSANAYEKLVDRLLKNPHYGERWGRHWLDAARYADSNGFNIDAPRSIWRWRDWVIDALNADMPFDRFTIEQLAGDLLPNATLEQKIATGFHRNTLINQEGGIDVEQFRIESVVDRVNTTGAVFLGLTLGCAQCHDHKYDPISTREYYQMFAFFNNADEPNLEILTPELQRERQRLRTELAAVEQQLKSLDPTTPATLEAWERSLTDETRPLLAPAIRKIFNTAPNGRNAKQLALIETMHRRLDQLRHWLGGVGQPTPFPGLIHTQLLTTRLQLERRRNELKASEPAVTTTMVLQERKTPRKTHVLKGGDFLRKGVVVGPGTLQVLHDFPAKAKPLPNRLDLAQWIVDPKNPLTPRVIANRIWMLYFGLGIVETENDFGTQGTPPSHPELLDWLASELIDRGWSLKAFHKLIVTSATYRQSSKARPDLQTIDPRNRLLARQIRLRLEAEIVRDVGLKASGLLSEKIGGPSVFPPQPDGVYSFTQIQREWKPSVGLDRYRRGMYTHFWRSAPHPALIVFDAPDSTTTCTRRNRSNTPLQALTLLNDAGFMEYASAFADRLLRERSTDADRIDWAFRLCVARVPSERERQRVQEFVGQLRRQLADQPQEVARLAGQAHQLDRAVWTLTARALLNLDECITRE